MSSFLGNIPVSVLSQIIKTKEEIGTATLGEMGVITFSNTLFSKKIIPYAGEINALVVDSFLEIFKLRQEIATDLKEVDKLKKEAKTIISKIREKKSLLKLAIYSKYSDLLDCKKKLGNLKVKANTSNGFDILSDGEKIKRISADEAVDLSKKSQEIVEFQKKVDDINKQRKNKESLIEEKSEVIKLKEINVIQSFIDLEPEVFKITNNVQMENEKVVFNVYNIKDIKDGLEMIKNGIKLATGIEAEILKPKRFLG